MASINSPTAETQMIRRTEIDLWSQLRVDAEPNEAKAYHHGADGFGYDSRVRVVHGGRTWWLGVDGDERSAELIDGAIPVPDWIEDVARHLGVKEVDA